jgi:AcrR family transcriptional regulator
MIPTRQDDHCSPAICTAYILAHDMSRCTVFCMPYPSKTDRQTILTAAVKELVHGGIRDLSLRNIAASLDLAPNAIYRYFSDRRALEAALANEAARRLVRTGYRNPRDVICLHQVRKGQSSPLRGDDDSPRARTRCDLPPKPLDVHCRAGATNCRVRSSCAGIRRALGVPTWSRDARSRSSVRRDQTGKRARIWV